MPDVAEGEVVYEIISGPNRQGQLLFHRFWRTTYIAGLADPPPGETHVRAQAFLADLSWCAVRDKAEGNTVRIIDRRVQA
jgi:hypothetical protein